jgi:hypothetical protein
VLWQEAIRVAGICGLYATSKALHFSYDRLKERSKESTGNGGIAEKEREVVRSTRAAGERRTALTSSDRVTSLGTYKEGGSRFVAVPMAPIRGGSPTTIELVGCAGDRMRVEMMGDIDVASLVQAFWRRGS